MRTDVLSFARHRGMNIFCYSAGPGAGGSVGSRTLLLFLANRFLAAYDAILVRGLSQLARAVANVLACEGHA